MKITKQLNQSRFWALTMGSTLLLGLSACGGSDSPVALDTGGLNDIEISGAFSTTSMSKKSDQKMAALGDLALVCATLTVPPQVGTGAVANDGTFSVTVTEAKGKKLSCYVASADNTDEVLAPLVFKDTTEKNINGEDKKENSRSIGGKASLGDIALDLDAGSATVDVANIEDSAAVTEVAGAGAWDVTGTWEFSKVPANQLPKGFLPICEEDDNDCHGPGEGMRIFFQLVDGVKATDATKPAYGMMMWEGRGGSSPTAGLDAYNACSGGGANKRLGTSFASLISNGVDFTDNTAGVTEGAFSWSTSVTINDSDIVSTTGAQDLIDGWKIEYAKTRWSIQTGCSSFSFRGKNVWRCVDDQGDGAGANDVYSFGAGGGCTVTGSPSTPVFVSDWSNMKGDASGAGFPTCGNLTPAAPFADFQGSSCAGYYDADGFGSGDAAVAVTCTSANAFSHEANPAPEDIDNDLHSSFDWNNIEQIAAGTDCSAISAATDEGELAQLKCYSNAFYQARLDDEVALCVPRLRTNWAANDPDDFILGNMDKPSAQVFANFVSFDADGVLTMFDESDDYQGVKSGENDWTDCHVRSFGTISLAPQNKNGTSVTQVRAGYTDSQVLVDNNKPACVGYFKDQEGTQNSVGAWTNIANFMFGMTKQ